MTLESFKESILKGIKECPKNWREGQKVFNYIDNHYNVARKVQCETKVDCFYDDKLIDKFIEESFKIINNHRK